MRPILSLHLYLSKPDMELTCRRRYELLLDRPKSQAHIECCHVVLQKNYEYLINATAYYWDVYRFLFPSTKEFHAQFVQIRVTCPTFQHTKQPIQLNALQRILQIWDQYCKTLHSCTRLMVPKTTALFLCTDLSCQMSLQYVYVVKFYVFDV